jgi:hypothetical protein
MCGGRSVGADWERRTPNFPFFTSRIRNSEFGATRFGIWNACLHQLPIIKEDADGAYI